MTHEITGPDIAAFGDVLDLLDIEAQEPGMSIERAAELMAALEQVRKRAADTITFLKARALTTLEAQPKLIGNQVFSRKPIRKKRPNHEAIRIRVISRALSNADGEASTPVEAAQSTYSSMMLLFVADATPPKAAGLKVLRMSDEDAFEFETTGYDLKITEIGE